MSPEQAAGKKVDRRSDIFSFGLLLYEMLSGQRAFSGDTPAATIEAIMRCQPFSLRAALPQVAPELDLIVMRCLDKEVSDRTQSIIDVKIALENILATRVAAGAMQSIAVLPFINMSADKENEYFADGLAEEIINVLAQNPDFKVIARTSSFSFRDKRIQIDEIAQKLGVEYVLEGGVRKTDSRIRVTVNLVKAVDGFQLWSQRFDSDIADIFTVQDEIGRAIARELKGTLSHQMSRSRSGGRTPNLEAYNAYLKGRYHLHRFTAADQRKAKDYFEEVIHLDPDYALGYSGLATYHAWGHSGPDNYS
jgi:TolB-like protein